ncbi:MAG TPA: glycosyl hydrolase family 39 [Bryobacteraceae bacterium]|jgi:xylan 1,4-beta-xylosidase|nr:glycosyl hydrolase family 39 [Bryobacteraceae bacterium]
MTLGKCGIAAVATLATFGISAPSAPADVETITIDATATGRPFPHFWERMFGSGRAVLSLRADYRDDLRSVKQITGFEYIRFHAVLDHDMGVYSEDAHGNPVYNFSYVDQSYDGLLANGVKPFVELSFMPKELAANPALHPFWYKPYPSPPNDPAKWSALVEAFTRHLVERYGRPEVESWYFEVWNEPNIDFWDGAPKQSTYLAFYDITARAVKKVDPLLRVGGPATAQAAWIPEFIAHCTEKHVPFDFVSTHVYGNDTSMDVFGRQMPIARKDMVAMAAKKVHDQVKASAAPATPVIWSEYNATYMNQTEVTDSAFMGPWLANNIRESDGMSEMMSYWCFSDVFEEQGVVKTPFYGGYGLIAEREIPKPAFRAFELLHRLGHQRLDSDLEDALVTKTGDGSIVVALWNYAEPGEDGAPKTFRLDVRGTEAKEYTMQWVSPDRASSRKAFLEMGSPASPSLAQIHKLIEASRFPAAEAHALDDPITLSPRTLAIIEIK